MEVVSAVMLHTSMRPIGLLMLMVVMCGATYTHYLADDGKVSPDL